jgi:chorismate-pyruvate lyase
MRGGHLGRIPPALFCMLLAAASFPALAGDAVAAAPPWPDTFVARLAALALLETLNADLLSHDSATLTLERWCDVHRLASPARIVAVRDRAIDKPVAADLRRDLGATSTEPIRYRRVKLVCGSRVLSEADNWYVPARLTPEMNDLLDTTDTPFGKAVRTLDFKRHTLSSTVLWSALPVGWESASTAFKERGGVLEIPAQLLQQRALLTTAEGVAFSEVVETYTADVLAFAPPFAVTAPPQHPLRPR